MDENKVNQIEENKELRRVHRNSVSNFPKELSLSPITMRDLLLFKEDILKEMKIYESNTNLSITKCSDRKQIYLTRKANYFRQE